jgi:hypothetical protein
VSLLEGKAVGIMIILMSLVEIVYLQSR